MNRFKLEDAIHRVASTEGDLDDLLKALLDHSKKLSDDEIYDYVNGVRSILNLRCARLWETFIQTFKLEAGGFWWEHDDEDDGQLSFDFDEQTDDSTMPSKTVTL